MARRRLQMRKIRDILRLHTDHHLTGRQIAQSLGLLHSCRGADRPPRGCGCQRRCKIGVKDSLPAETQSWRGFPPSSCGLITRRSEVQILPPLPVLMPEAQTPLRFRRRLPARPAAAVVGQVVICSYENWGMPVRLDACSMVMAQMSPSVPMSSRVFSSRSRVSATGASRNSMQRVSVSA